MRLEVHCSVEVKPSDPSQFIVPHEIDIICETRGGDSVVVGRVAVDYLDIGRIEEEGQDVFHVCDSESAGWAFVYEATIEAATEATDGYVQVREDFNLDAPINSLAFLHRCVFHPELDDWRSMVISRICSLFPNFAAVVMFKKVSPLAEAELASLGFRVVAGADLFLRPNMYRCDYVVANDPKDPFEFVVREDTTSYVNQLWEERGFDSRDVGSPDF